MKNIYILIAVLLFSTSIFPQGKLYTPLNVQSAYENNTRSQDGNPGKNYWQNKAEYNIKVKITPETRLLKGTEEINYINNSPDTLKELVIHLFANIYKKGAPRDFGMDPADEGEGVSVEKLVYNGQLIDSALDNKLVSNSATYFQLKLREPLLPKSSCKLDINWSYTINKGSEIRTGTIDSTTFFLAYFFPRVAVYDDIDGWNYSEYTGQSEFYNDFSDFNINIIVPKNQIVWGTGMLVNADKNLTPKYLAKYNAAMTSDGIIDIIDSLEYKKGDITFQKENTWNFKAENVVDFAFGISDHYLWDATSYAPDKNSKRRVLITAAYDKSSHDYYKVAETTKKVLTYMSEDLPAYPYPYPAMTVFNGKSGMEYPMMVNDISEPDSLMPGLTAHETSHTYFPFFMGINETKYAYMDEGWGAFFDYMISSNVFGNEYIVNNRIKGYMKWAGKDLDMPVFSISKYLRAPVYRNNAYIKAAVFYLILKDQLGDDLFKECLQEYMKRWNSKHPIPFDFFNTIEEVSQKDFTWLINPWFFEFGYVDIGIKDIIRKDNKYEISIEKIGRYPVPVKLNIYYQDGTTQLLTRKADIWRNGENIIKMEVNSDKTIVRAELFNKFNLDANTSNDTYVMKKNI